MLQETHAAFPLALFASVPFFVTTAVADPPAAPNVKSITSRTKREAVLSTAITFVGYSRRLHALEIASRNGAMMIAPSKARIYDEHIRRKYRPFHIRRRSE